MVVILTHKVMAAAVKTEDIAAFFNTMLGKHCWYGLEHVLHAPVPRDVAELFNRLDSQVNGHLGDTIIILECKGFEDVTVMDVSG